MPLRRLVRTMNPVAVELAELDIRQVAMPDLVGLLRQLDPLRLLGRRAGVEKTQLDLRGMLREQREVDPHPVPGGPERIRTTQPDTHEKAPGQAVKPRRIRRQHTTPSRGGRDVCERLV